MRIVQQQQGELLMGMASRHSRDLISREQKPLIAAPFKEYEALKQFDVTLHGSKREDFVSICTGLQSVCCCIMYYFIMESRSAKETMTIAMKHERQDKC